MELTRTQCINLCKSISNLSIQDLNNYPHRLSAYVGYKKEIASRFLDELGHPQSVEDISLNLDYFENIFSKVIYSNKTHNWALPGIAHLYLSLYEGDKFPIIQGVNTYTFIKGQHRYNFITSTEGKKIWFKWMYALFAPKDLSIELQKSLYADIPTLIPLKSEKSGKELIGALFISLNAPSYDPHSQN